VNIDAPDNMPPGDVLSIFLARASGDYWQGLEVGVGNFGERCVLDVLLQPEELNSNV
jgi:hypothetical protein